MFYSFIRIVARIIVFLINGNAHYLNKEKLPSGNYILVGPHRAWFDMIYFALGAAPKKFSFMAKEELFKNPILRYILVHANAFPVDRKNPGPSVIKTPVNWLKKRDISLIMFPSGTRHSQNLKGGVLLIARLANVPIVPTVYQGPTTLKGLLKRQKVTIAFGDPIELNSRKKLTEDEQQVILEKMTNSFKKIDAQINPDYVYIDESKIN
ncbi:lysophospholipid acyltransferase family protein [Liquorilactobacillus cacaonum]|uniref:1-acyl-sn-glycerol-3-phosphate acyltransferase n=1 Tax=Liquorilactobacillus cacaonum DSM 21116 TaxID=1423729 RepID=A0A0R2CIY1_9LACO|nr:1-acyl-sn-glycerol-3-phosphate acyltransferase [Liquorilactobacillus cacaonum]KRM91074.1 1-acyl-sn-glycerol-3-phosphate acyltransferase [Liquorilactobacillus cacaonum DSM 21116]